MTSENVFVLIREAGKTSYPVGVFRDWDQAIQAIQHRIMNCEAVAPATNTIPAWPLSDPSKGLMGSVTWAEDDREAARGLYLWREPLQ